MSQLKKNYIKLMLKFHIMKKREQEKQEKEIKEKLLCQEEEREQILIELNKLKEKVLILEKELSEYREEKDQLVKELVVVNKNLIKIEALKMEEMINNINTQEIKENPAVENKKCLDHHEASLENEDFNVAPSENEDINAPPLNLNTLSTDSVPLAISLNRECMDHEAALQNKDFVSSSHAPVFQSEPLNATSLDLSSLNYKPLKCEEVREHDDRQDEFDRRETNVHAPTLLTLGSVSGDFDYKQTLEFKKLLELVKSIPENPESQNIMPLEISKNVTNLYSLKQNKDINKQGICDGDFIENRQLPQAIRRGGITSGYPYLRPAQLPHNLYPFPPSYLNINANMYPPMSSTYANSYINPNFMPPLICPQTIPVLSPVACIGISHTNLFTCLPPIYNNISHVNPSSLPPVTNIGISRANSSRANSFRAKSSRVKPSRFSSPPTYAGTSCINPAPPLPCITYSSTSYVNPLSSSSVPINIPPVKPPSLPSDNYINTSHANPSSHLPPFTDVNTSCVSPAHLSPIICSSTSLSSDNYVDTSRANSSPLPSVHYVNISRAKPSPSISPPYPDSSSISPSCPDFSPISPPFSLPLVTCANTSHVNSHSSYPVIRISVSPVNPSSSLPS